MGSSGNEEQSEASLAGQSSASFDWTYSSNVSESTQKLQGFIKVLTSSTCSVHKVGSVKLELFEDGSLSRACDKMRRELNKSKGQGFNFYYEHQVDFEVIRDYVTMDLVDWEVDLIYLVIKRRPVVKRWTFGSGKEKRWHDLFSCLLVIRHGGHVKFRNHLLITCCLKGSFWTLIKSGLQEVWDCHIVQMNSISSDNLKTISGAYLMACINNLMATDGKANVVVTERTSEVDEDGVKNVLLMTVNLPVQLFDLADQKARKGGPENFFADAMSLWHEAILALGQSFPLTFHTTFESIEFPGFKVTSGGEIRTENPSDRCCFTLLNSLLYALRSSSDRSSR